MIQPVRWYAHYRSDFNPRDSIIVETARRIGTADLKPGSWLRAGRISITFPPVTLPR